MIYLIKSYEKYGISINMVVIRINKISGNIGNGQIDTFWYDLDIEKIRFKSRIYFLHLILNEDNHSINNFESKISQTFTNSDVLSRLQWT